MSGVKTLSLSVRAPETRGDAVSRRLLGLNGSRLRRRALS